MDTPQKSKHVFRVANILQTSKYEAWEAEVSEHPKPGQSVTTQTLVYFYEYPCGTPYTMYIFK